MLLPENPVVLAFFFGRLALVKVGMEVLYETKESFCPFKRVLEEGQSENHRDEGQMASKQDGSELQRGPAGPSASVTLR